MTYRILWKLFQMMIKVDKHNGIGRWSGDKTMNKLDTFLISEEQPWVKLYTKDLTDQKGGLF